MFTIAAFPTDPPDPEVTTTQEVVVLSVLTFDSSAEDVASDAHAVLENAREKKTVYVPVPPFWICETPEPPSGVTLPVAVPFHVAHACTPNGLNFTFAGDRNEADAVAVATCAEDAGEGGVR
jgi:hypothetical protein